MTDSITVGVSEAAKIIGVCPDTIRRIISDGDLPAFRAGRGKLRGRIRIRRDALQAFIAKREADGVVA